MMWHTDMTQAVRIESIFHPSDFSAASEVAFAHALKIALVTGAKLNILHATSADGADWSEFPGVRATLERWGLIPEGSTKSAVVRLGIEVLKVIARNRNPVKASLEFLERHPASLIVLAVHQHQGRMRWLERRTGEPIAQSSGETTLFIPHGVRGFVSPEDGSVLLRNILVPIARKPRAQPAVDAAARLIRNLQLPAGAVTLVHVGNQSEAPAVRIPNDTGWAWQTRAEQGEADEMILNIAKETSADLIVMTTDGPDGFLEGLRGSTSQRVLAGTHCPLAVLPVGSVLA